jgi:hypothetical protein
MGIVGQFPKSRKIRSLTEPGLEQVSEALEGEALLQPKLPWLVKLLGGGDWRSWTMWSFVRDRLLIVVTLMHESAMRDRELESMVRMMLSRMELPEVPADPPDVFAKRVLDLTQKKFPLLNAKLADEFHLQIGESSLNLFNFYRAYTREPNSFEKLMLPALTTVVQVQEWGESQTDPPLEIVRERLMPMLYPEDVWKERFSEFVGQPWVAGLVVLYVVDEANAYWYVRNELLDRWSLTGSQLHDIAVGNLQDYFERKPMEMAVAGAEEQGPTLLMPGRPDSYNSSRLLSETFLARLRDFVGGDLAVGLPGRDFFVAVVANAPEMVDHVRRRVREDFRQTDHPLTDRMLLITADGVSELIDD